MKSIPYDPAIHLDMIKLWHEQWGHSLDIVESLPDSGLIIPNVCACFLYKTNSNMCMVENLISNKDCDEETRQIGLDIIFKDMLQLVKDNGFKKVLSLVNNPNVIKRCLDIEYTISNSKYHVMIRSL